MDRYIDVYEVSEYGRFFVDRVVALEGMSPMVDVKVLGQRVMSAVQEVENVRAVSGTETSTERGGRVEVATLADEMRTLLRRFAHYLKSLPADAPVDMHSFFAEGRTGTLYRLKAADLLSVSARVLNGFTLPMHASLPGAESWQAAIAGMRTSLAAHLGNKQGASHSARHATAALSEARRDFLRVYNRVAKRVVRGLLVELGREREYRSFFLDLQVSEGAHRPADAPPETPTPNASAPEALVSDALASEALEPDASVPQALAPEAVPASDAPTA